MRAIFSKNVQGSLLADYITGMRQSLSRGRGEAALAEAKALADDASRAHADFLSNMNHELRTPLNAIIGFASMLREHEKYDFSSDQWSEYAEYILQSADLLLGHIDTILEISALESGEVELIQQELDLNEMLGEAIERAGVRARAAGVEISLREADEKVLAWGDETRAAQAIDHVLQSALKACAASDKEKENRVLARAILNDAGAPEIAVRDDGEGYSDDELNEAFNLFSENNRGLDRSFSKSGVGYAIAKAFIELQGGAFRIKSRKGRGTLVTLSLPLSAADAPAANEEAEKIHAA